MRYDDRLIAALPDDTETAWVKSSRSFSNSNCVEVAWLKSSASTNDGACTEVASLPGGMIGVRDSKDPGGAVLRFTPAEFAAFREGIKAGEFDHFGRSD